MKSKVKIFSGLISVLFFNCSSAQIKNEKIEIVKIYGNCGMCETTIEDAGNKKKIARVDWNKDTKVATLTYDSKKTNQDEILKRIALAGYDNDKFLAPDDAYAKLPECCKYKRNKKSIAKKDTAKTDEQHQAIITETISANPLKNVFDNYFLLKDALVKTDATAASSKAKELVISISSVKMEALKMEEHMA